MKVLVQRVLRCAVFIGAREIGATGRGSLMFVGVGIKDSERDVEYLASKVAALRIFDDKNGKMNLSLRDIGGETMVVSQFTLMADTGSGNRPGFSLAAPPGQAERLYRSFADALKKLGVPVQMGQFGADMKVELVNEGPVTILLESK